MGIREEQKKVTRENIYKKTLDLLLNNGFVKVSTKEIAMTSKVAQGSIFLHFENKENLLNTIISTELEKLENQLHNKLNVKSSRDSFLKNLFDILIKNENILSRVYKDYSYLPVDIKKSVDHINTIMKNLIYDNVRNTVGKKISILDSFIYIDAFMSQIKEYLLDKEVYTKSNSLIKQRRGKLVKLYKALFS